MPGPVLFLNGPNPTPESIWFLTRTHSPTPDSVRFLSRTPDSVPFLSRTLADLKHGLVSNSDPV